MIIFVLYNLNTKVWKGLTQVLRFVHSMALGYYSNKENLKSSFYGHNSISSFLSSLYAYVFCIMILTTHIIVKSYISCMAYSHFTLLIVISISISDISPSSPCYDNLFCSKYECHHLNNRAIHEGFVTDYIIIATVILLLMKTKKSCTVMCLLQTFVFVWFCILIWYDKYCLVFYLIYIFKNWE